jgi:hypothetical protein
MMLDHTDDILRREHHIKRTLLAFAVAVVLAAGTWLAFTTYL